MLPREVLDGGLTISIPTTTPDGSTVDTPHFFPPGTVIGVSAYAIHHNATYFPDPFTFQPERWVESAEWTEESVAVARSAFCAFSLGTRGCVGRSLAYKELQLSLALILFSFDLRFAEVEEEPTSKKPRHPMRWRKDEYQLFDRFLAETDGPMVEFRARQV